MTIQDKEEYVFSRLQSQHLRRSYVQPKPKMNNRRLGRRLKPDAIHGDHWEIRYPESMLWYAWRRVKIRNWIDSFVGLPYTTWKKNLSYTLAGSRKTCEISAGRSSNVWKIWFHFIWIHHSIFPKSLWTLSLLLWRASQPNNVEHLRVGATVRPAK